MSKGRMIAGRYRLGRRLGRGSFGVVWEADELLGGEPIASVAVKIFTAEVDRREIALLAGLSHPSILTYRAVVEDEDDVCLVTELADGGDAAGRLKEWPDGLPADDVRGVIRSVAEALIHMHGQGWIHRDVKPANILFVRDAPKLGDVGTARALSATAKATSTASLAYAAPEFFSGQVGPAVDTYALGCTVFELMTGRLPFDGTMAELVHKHMTASIIFPSDLPPDLVELIRGCTVKEPDRRWPLSRVLAAVTSPGMPAANVPPQPVPETPSRANGAPTTESSSGAAATSPAAESAGPKAARPAKRETPKAKEKGKPTPLDPALRRHLRRHGKRWGDAAAWRAFMQSAGDVAREHGLSERSLIRRAGQLLPEVEAAALSEQEEIARVGAWVAALGGPQWSAPDWADFLDQINARDEVGLGRVRDAFLTRLYPRGAGATRTLDLGNGIAHLLVFTPLDRLHRPTTAVFKAATGATETTIGLWHSARPISVKEWAAISGRSAPAGLKLDSAALAPKAVADDVLARLQRRFPLDELRWPLTLEYDGIKWGREQAAEKVAAAAKRANPGAVQRRAPPTRKKPKTLGAALLQTVGKAAADMVKEMNEAWLADLHTGDQRSPKQKRLAMNLVSPVPKVR